MGESMTTMEHSRDIRYILKIGKAAHIQALLDRGEMYFNTVDWFRQADSNQERYDSNEGASSIKQVVWLKMRAEDGQEFYLSRPGHPLHRPEHIKLASANLMTHIEVVKGNIFSCTGIDVTETHLLGKGKLDRRFGTFGEAVALITNPNQFLTRVEETLTRLGYKYRLGLVNYYDPDVFEGDLNPFSKKVGLSYQREVRIWIDNTTNEPVKIEIGSIRDIARGHWLELALEPEQALRVSDRSGTPQAGNPAEEYSGERDPRRIWPRGTPKKTTLPWR